MVRRRSVNQGADEIADRAQHFATVAERHNPDFEILIGQLSNDAFIDVVFDKAIGVLGHAEFFEPVRNLWHRGHQDRSWPSFWPPQQNCTTARNGTSRPKAAQRTSLITLRPALLSCNCDLPSKTPPEPFSADRELSTDAETERSPIGTFVPFPTRVY
jgi:hypothetical protein